jgi:hypothetical protein
MRTRLIDRTAQMPNVPLVRRPGLRHLNILIFLHTLQSTPITSVHQITENSLFQ